MEGVGIENGLDHDEGLGQILPGKVVSVIRRLVGTVVEHLKKWRSSQVEHELHAHKKKTKGYICDAGHAEPSTLDSKTRNLDSETQEGQQQSWGQGKGYTVLQVLHSRWALLVL